MRLLITLATAFSLFNLQASDSNLNNNYQCSLGASLAPIENFAETDPEWKILQDSLFSVEYPSTWEMNHTGQKGLSFVVISPLEGDKDIFRENLSFVIQSMKADDSSLEDFVLDNTSQIMEMINKSKLIKNEEKMLGKIKFREVVYSGVQNNMELINTQRYMFYRGDAYVFTFTRVATTEDKFKSDGEKIMNSLKFK